MLFKTLRKGVLAQFIVGAAAMVFAIALQPSLHHSLATPPPSPPNAPRLSIPLQFNFASDFSEGLAPVRMRDKSGYIDQTGNLVIPAQYNRAFPFSEGLAVVEIGDKYGYIDKTGNIAIQPQFGEVGSFSEGLAVVP